MAAFIHFYLMIGIGKVDMTKVPTSPHLRENIFRFFGQTQGHCSNMFPAKVRTLLLSFKMTTI